MRNTLTFSIMKPIDANVTVVMHPLIKQFEAARRMKIDLQALDWGSGLEKLIANTLQAGDIQVSEIGTSWLSSFIGMNCIQPFERHETHLIGHKDEFIPVAWDNVSVAGSGEIWAYPWLIGTRVLYYRKDILEKLDLDPAAAFTTHEALVNTLTKIKESGLIAPMVLPTQNTINTLHFISHWVWGSGGDFIDETGKEVLFNSPESLDGLTNYFNLIDYLPENPENLDVISSQSAFWQEGAAAISIGGHWLARAQKEVASPEVLENLGVAAVPGVTFVGGSNLVIWEHARHRRQANQLMRFLVSEEVQRIYPQKVGLLPVRKDVLDSLDHEDQHINQVVIPSLESGRGFPAVRLWGVIERRLTDSFGAIWAQILEDPAASRREIIKNTLDPLAKRLALMIKN